MSRDRGRAAKGGGRIRVEEDGIGGMGWVGGRMDGGA